jgi:phosphate transport system protein
MGTTEPERPLPAGAKALTHPHRVRAYDAELERLRTLVLEMGERALEQVRGAVAALLDPDPSPAYRVLDREPQVDFLALDADEEVFHVIARRQPAAVDLRIVLALSRLAGEAERAADKAAHIASRALEFRAGDTDLPVSLRETLGSFQDVIVRALERSVAAVSNFDIELAIGVFEDELAMRAAGRAMQQALAGATEPPLAPAQVGALFIVTHALELIGKHSCAMAEQVIYVAEGKDVRFRNREILIETLRHRGT